MIKPITNCNEAIEIYFESGSAHLRFKEGVRLESMLKEKLDKPKILIPKDVTQLSLSIEVGLLNSSLMNPDTPATSGIVMPATARKAMAWMNHFGESGLSSISQ